MELERRIFGATEVRASKNADGTMTVKGYAARYNVLSHDLGGFRERIAPGAFDDIMGTDPDVVCLLNHDNNKILGRTTAGTLRLEADSRGLAFECDLPNTQAGRDTYESVKRGDLNGCSFAFQLGERMDEFNDEEIEDDEGIVEKYRAKARKVVKQIVRTIRKFKSLLDVSIVTSRAYPNTSVDARNLVGAEVRSRVQEMSKPRQTSQYWRSLCAANGVTNQVSFQDVKEIRDLRKTRRRSLLDQV
jgi:hypothetical protein